MSGFSALWLALRESLDAQSRDAGLVASLREESLEIIDLGAGTGANLRYAAPRLEGVQDWLLVERERRLLGAVEECMEAWADQTDTQLSASGGNLFLHAERFDCRVRKLELDLASHLEQLPIPAAGVVTASALLDLVSEEWLRRLIRKAADAAAALWFTLTYDGRIGCVPVEPEDEEVRALFNRHQLRDKGFGPALGPEAGRAAVKILAEHGYRVRSGPSDWHVGQQQPQLQQALIEGWFAAASEIAPFRTAALQNWMKRRCAHIDAGRSVLLVGHLDLVATLEHHLDP
jgi:hypothetical protein